MFSSTSYIARSSHASHRKKSRTSSFVCKIERCSSTSLSVSLSRIQFSSYNPRTIRFDSIRRLLSRRTSTRDRQRYSKDIAAFSPHRWPFLKLASAPLKWRRIFQRGGGALHRRARRRLNCSRKIDGK